MSGGASDTTVEGAARPSESHVSISKGITLKDG